MSNNAPMPDENKTNQKKKVTGVAKKYLSAINTKSSSGSIDLSDDSDKESIDLATRKSNSIKKKAVSSDTRSNTASKKSNKTTITDRETYFTNRDQSNNSQDQRNYSKSVRNDNQSKIYHDEHESATNSRADYDNSSKNNRYSI